MSARTTEQLARLDAARGPRKLGPDAGRAVDLGSVGVRFMAWSEETGGGFSLVEHPIPPRTLVAPVHRHANEDEYSFVLEGRMGALLGEDVIYAEAGELAFKPATSGTPSGIPTTPPPASWRSSRPEGSSTFSTS